MANTDTVVAPQRIIRRHELKAFTGYSIGHIYELIAHGKFPKPIPLGPRAVGWLSDEIAAHQAACIAERDREAA